MPFSQLSLADIMPFFQLSLADILPFSRLSLADIMPFSWLSFADLMLSPLGQKNKHSYIAVKMNDIGNSSENT